MGTVYDIDLYGGNKELVDMVDPCSTCTTKSKKHCTCDRASIWWNQFAKRYKKQGVMNKLGIRNE